MPYLHGDVAGDEFEAACSYEYARESAILRKAAEMYQSGKRQHNLWLPLEKETNGDTWFLQGSWSAFYECPSFPAKGWNELSNSERKELLHMGGFPLPSNVIPPLRMNEVWLLNAQGVFDEFKAMAEKVMEEKRRLAKPDRVYPIIEGLPRQKEKASQWVQALFTIDFGKTKKRLTEEFAKWLEMPVNKSRFAAHKKDPTGKTGMFKDRLKDLAAWRIYCGCDRNGDRANDFANQNRIKGRPFHDSRQGQLKKCSLHEAPLYSEEAVEAGFLKAQRRVLDYRADFIPWEYGKYAEKRRRQEEERKKYWESRIRVVLRQTKISKRSS